MDCWGGDISGMDVVDVEASLGGCGGFQWRMKRMYTSRGRKWRLLGEDVKDVQTSRGGCEDFLWRTWRLLGEDVETSRERCGGCGDL